MSPFDVTRLSVAGSHGTASRGDGQLDGVLPGVANVIDAWVLRPHGGDPLTLVTVDTASELAGDAAARFLVLVADVDTAVLDVCREHGLQESLAVVVWLAFPLGTDELWRAQEVTRHLARAAVNGAVPMTPVLRDHRMTWEVVAGVIGGLVAKQDGTRTGAVESVADVDAAVEATTRPAPTPPRWNRGAVTVPADAVVLDPYAWVTGKPLERPGRVTGIGP